jgi:hypothetical protein
LKKLMKWVLVCCGMCGAVGLLLAWSVDPNGKQPYFSGRIFLGFFVLNFLQRFSCNSSFKI